MDDDCGVKSIFVLRILTFMALVFLFGGNANGASPDEICPIRNNRLGEQIYRFTKRGSEKKVLVCANCAILETTCFICALPVKDKYLQLADGRLLCDEDAKTSMLDQDQAEKVFDDVKRDVQSMLAQLGSLPHHNIHFVLEAKARLDKSGANLISAHDDRLLMGLTRTTSREAGKFVVAM